jgi:hypothetical protein
LVAPEFAQGAKQRVEITGLVSTWRNQREEQALAVEFFKVKGLFGKDGLWVAPGFAGG